jgi:hypothetical protein
LDATAVVAANVLAYQWYSFLVQNVPDADYVLLSYSRSRITAIGKHRRPTDHLGDYISADGSLLI